VALKESNKNRKKVEEMEKTLEYLEKASEDLKTVTFSPIPRGYWVFVGIIALVGIFLI